MEDRLKKLKRSMKTTVFDGLTFTDDHKSQVKSKIDRMSRKSEDAILEAILQLLVQERTGFELNTLIRARGIPRFEDHEGDLYMFLHRLEQKGFLQSRWEEDEAKYYLLTNKGRKCLNSAGEVKFSMRTVLKELVER